MREGRPSEDINSERIGLLNLSQWSAAFVSKGAGGKGGLEKPCQGTPSSTGGELKRKRKITGHPGRFDGIGFGKKEG